QYGKHLVQPQPGPLPRRLKLRIVVEIRRWLAGNVSIGLPQTDFRIERQTEGFRENRPFQAAIDAVIAISGVKDTRGCDARVDFIGSVGLEHSLQLIRSLRAGAAIREDDTVPQHRLRARSDR